MLKTFYKELKSNIHYYLPEVKTIARFNNQFEHSNGDGEKGRNESAFNYPAVYLEFNDFEFRQLGLGVLEYDFNLTLHIGWKSLKKEDEEIFTFLERLYWVVQRFQQGSSARLSKTEEVWDTNHDNITIITSKYRGYDKEFNRYVLTPPDYTLDTITGFTQTDIIVSATTFDNSWTGATDTNGRNIYIPPIDCDNDND